MGLRGRNFRGRIMKAIPYIFFGGLIFAGSCSNMTDPASGKRVDVEYFATKAHGLDELESVAVLVFDRKGQLDALSCNNEGKVKMSVAAGEDLEYRVLANAPEAMFEKILSIADFKALRVRLNQNILIGKGREKFMEGTVVSVSLERPFSKIRLEKITPAFYGKSYHGSKVFLERVFIINTPSEALLEEDSECPLHWYNKMSLDPNPEALLVKELHREISGNSDMEIGLEFICIPNVIDNAVSSLNNKLWSPRNTRLVAEISMDGKAYYYPVTMPAMKRNRIYKISKLVMQTSGSGHPDEPVLRESMKFSIEIMPWKNETKEYPLE